MTTKERLLQELESAPEELLEEVLKFVLATKNCGIQQSNGAASTSETVSTDNPSSDEQPNGLASLIALVERFAAEMTEEEIAQLPKDGALEHDHYIYGTPKRYSKESEQ